MNERKTTRPGIISGDEVTDAIRESGQKQPHPTAPNWALGNWALEEARREAHRREQRVTIACLVIAGLAVLTVAILDPVIGKQPLDVRSVEVGSK